MRMAVVNKLSARKVASLDVPGRHSDGANLYLNITKSGAKSWVFLYRLNGKQREMGLGTAGPGGVGLAEAREAAARARDLLRSDIDPLEARRTAQKASGAVERATFGEYADAFVALHEQDWRNPKHRAQWRATLGATYIKSLRERPIDDISTDDVLAVLKPIWNTKRETANRIRQRVERVIDAATAEGKRKGENPARWKGHLDLILPRHGKATKGHFKAMPWRDLPAFWDELTQREGVAPRAVEFLILTAARSGEVRGATWRELDLEEKMWTIPAERMKAGREHRVPLSAPAIAAAEAMMPLRPRRDWDDALVFPGLRRARLSDMTLGAVLKRMEVTNATIHGFRSSFRDWGSETEAAPFEVMETALAHAVGDATVQAYARSDLFRRRVDLMRRWAEFVAGEAPDAV